MKLLEYLDQTDEQQTDTLYQSGQHIDTVKTPDAEYQLYSLFTFYVELTLTPEGKHIQRLSIFEGGKRLEKYPPTLGKSIKPWG